jgi:transposase
MWFAGIDWADRHHEVVVLDDHGQSVAQCHVPHSVAGLAQLSAILNGLTDQQGQVLCVVETNQGLLISTLLAAGWTVYPVPTTTVKGLRRPGSAKTDAIDATLLARKGRLDWPQVTCLRPDSPGIEELKALTHDQQTLLTEHTRLVNQLTACVKTYYPVVVDLFDTLGRPSARAFLRAFPCLEQARAASVEQIRTVLATVHCAHAQRKATAIWTHLQMAQLQASAGLTRAKTRLMLALLAQVDQLSQDLVVYDQVITEVFHRQADAPLFASLPGAGRRLAPQLLAEWGDDRHRFATVAQIQALAGTAPVIFQSGALRQVRRRRACNNALRQALYHFAHESLLLEPWARAYYDRKRQQGKTYAMAMRALGNHWVRIIFAMWQTQQPYDRTTFEQAQQQHQRHAA